MTKKQPSEKENLLGDSLIAMRRRERCHSWHQIFEDPSGKSILAVSECIILKNQSSTVSNDFVRVN